MTKTTLDMIVFAIYNYMIPPAFESLLKGQYDSMVECTL